MTRQTHKAFESFKKEQENQSQKHLVKSQCPYLNVTLVKTLSEVTGPEEGQMVLAHR